MKFVDTVEIGVRAGHGGPGSAHFHREKYVEKGGPDGGDGGRGADVVLQADPSLSTLDRFLSHKFFAAPNGEPGRSLRRFGQDADPLVIRLPVGTVVEDADTGEFLCELIHPEDSVVIAEGGKGGLGNVHFATSVNQAPTYAQPGIAGTERRLRLTLKLIADAGLIGLPNAGKSTLLSVVSNNNPAIGDYPFTTLNPNLGVLIRGERRLILADIPGIIEGASKGAGLGLSFLKHIERVNVIIFVLDIGSLDPTAEFRMLRMELSKYSEALVHRPYLVLFNKADQVEYDADFEKNVEELFREKGRDLDPPLKEDADILFISAKEEKNLDRFLETLFSLFKEETHAERLIRKR
ncbi:GTPase ObgE [Leptonema illini]|uniref:GTPase Obg n=1 Tax=Leptonema illini DSM 21528 TaxID=929563 RepID=H2CBX9_9LEPT|nr:GTPase ObgE [Leptonema illini]EHQ08651.1 GTPase obg [Leptonema illini DSM 21528]